MPLDGISSEFLRDELARTLVGARLQQVYQCAPLALYLQFRKPGKSLGLHISINPARAAIYLENTSPGRCKEQNNFVNSLRKHLLGAELIDITQPPTERIFSLSFRGKNEIGDWEEFQLVAEIMGKHSNLILLRPDKIIHDSFRHIDSSLNRYREVMPARPYILPPSQDKLDYRSFLDELEAYQEGRKIFNFLGEPSTLSLKRLLLSNLAGFSPLLVNEVLYRAGIEANLRNSDLKEAELLRLSQSLAGIISQIAAKNVEPALYYLNDQAVEAKDFYSLPLSIYPRKTPYPTLSAAMSAYYNAQGREERFKQLEQKVEQALKRLFKTNQRRYELHLSDKAEGKKASTYKLYGDLLQSKIYEITPKSHSILVENYYEEDLPEIEIPLDPALSAAGNVNNYYKRYRKAQEKEKHALHYLAEDKLEYAWLHSLEALLETAEDPEDLLAIWEEIKSYHSQEQRQQNGAAGEIPRNQLLNPGKPGRKNKYRPQNKSTRKAKKRTQEASVKSSFREFKTSDGFLVRVGRNNISNDRLSFKKARKDDLWFHVQNRPGSHTVLHLEGKEATDLAIEEAAAIAAYYSSANKTPAGAKLMVDFCPIKNVTRIPGAKPGLVNYRDYKSCYVEAKLPVQQSDND